MENEQYNRLVEELKQDEGYQGKVYFDSRQNLTCGWGHHLYVGSIVPEEINEIFLKMDIRDAIRDFWKLPAKYRVRLNPIRRRAIVNMIFNMGLQKVLGFKKMWAAITQEDWPEAKNQLLDSNYYKQVGKRAERLADLLESGKEIDET